MSENERLGRVNYNDEQRPDPDRLGTASRKHEGSIVIHFTLQAAKKLPSGKL